MQTQAVSTGAGFWSMLAVIACMAILQILDPVLFQIFRHSTFDQFQRIWPRAYQDSPVKIIDIDEESLDKLGQWPWPRTRIAELINLIQTIQPKAIAFDILFAEPDRTSPQAMLKIWPVSIPLRNALAGLPDHDQQMAHALAGKPTVLGFSSDNSTHRGKPLFIPKNYFVNYGGALSLDSLPVIRNTVTPLAPFALAAAGIGALDFIPDADGIVRRVPLLFAYEKKLVSALTTETLRIAQQSESIGLIADAETGTSLDRLRIGKLTLPVTARGEFWIHFTRPVPKRFIPAWKVLAKEISPASLKGAIILIGASAQGLMDLRFSPLGNIIPGIEIHAQALEQMLAGDFLQRPEWMAAIEFLILVGGGIAIGVVTLSVGALLSSAVFAAALALLWLSAWHSFIDWHWLLDPTLPSIAWTLSFGVAGIFRHLYSERRHRWIKQAFARYISPNRVEHLIAHPEALELGGRRQTCSFVFSDLADFTGLMERMDPGAAVALLNHYLDEMITIAFKHHGTLDRIVGDAVAIMFSAPIEQADHRLRALNCAIDMQRFATNYSRELNAKGIRFGQTRIGVHTGEVIVGNFGGNTIFDYRALGDPVNTASRLEGANKYLGTSICVSEATVSGCADLPVRPIGRLRVKGKSIPLQVFEPSDSDRSGYTPMQDYLAAFKLMCDGQPSALQIFQQLSAAYPNDPLVAFHSKRLRDNKTGDLIELSGK